MNSFLVLDFTIMNLYFKFHQTWISTIEVIPVSRLTQSVLNSVLNRVISPCGEFGQYCVESFCFFLFECSKIVNGGTKGAKNYGKSQMKESDMKVTHGTNWDKRLK